MDLFHLFSYQIVRYPVLSFHMRDVLLPDLSLKVLYCRCPFLITPYFQSPVLYTSTVDNLDLDELVYSCRMCVRCNSGVSSVRYVPLELLTR